MPDVLSRLRSMLRKVAGDPSPAEVSSLLKQEAARQPVTIRLTDEQLDALRSQWAALDPSRPAAVTFEVDGRPVGDFRIASCAYWGDTCCA